MQYEIKKKENSFKKYYFSQGNKEIVKKLRGTKLCFWDMERRILSIFGIFFLFLQKGLGEEKREKESVADSFVK